MKYHAVFHDQFQPCIDTYQYYVFFVYLPVLRCQLYRSTWNLVLMLFEPDIFRLSIVENPSKTRNPGFVTSLVVFRTALLRHFLWCLKNCRLKTYWFLGM